MAYFGTGGQFGGWLQNPQFNFNKGGIKPFGDFSKGATSSGGVRSGGSSGGGSQGGVRADNTGYDVGPGVRSYGRQDNAYNPPPARSSGAVPVPQYSDMASVTDQGSGGGAEETNRMGDLNEFMKEMMGSDWYKATRKGSELELPPEYEPPPAWKPEDAGIGEAQVDPMAVINAAKPGLTEQMNRGFADAAMRQGQTGAMMGSGYSKALGGVARNAANDLNKITMDTLFKSSENAADREQQARQSALDRSQGTWGQTFGQDQDAWRTHGDWQQNLGKWGGDREMSMIQQLLGMFGGGGF